MRKTNAVAKEEDGVQRKAELKISVSEWLRRAEDYMGRAMLLTQESNTVK